MWKRLWPVALVIAGCGRPNPQGTATPAPAQPTPAVTARPESPPAAPAPTPGGPANPAPVAAAPKPPATPVPAPDEPVTVEATTTIKLGILSTISITLSPDGTVVGVGGKTSASSDSYVSDYYELPTGKKLGRFPGLSGPGSVTDRREVHFTDSSFEPGSDFNEPNIDFFRRDIVTGQQTRVLQLKKVGRPRGTYLRTPDGTVLVSGRGSELAFLKVPGGGPALPAVATDQPILAMSGLYAAGTRVATLHGGGKLLVWDVTTGKQADALDLGRPTQNDEGLQVAGDGRAMLVKNAKGATVVWDLKARKPCRWASDEYRTGFQPLSGGAVCYTETYYKLTPSRKCVVVADMETGKTIERLLLPADDRQIWLFTRVSDDGRRIACLSADTETVYAWDRPKAK